MHASLEQSFLIAALLLLLSLVASKVSSRLGVPVLLLFLLLGMLAGADGPGGIYFDDAELSENIGVVALAFILFSGGLDTSWRAVRPVLRAGLSLANGGVLVSAGLVGAFAHWLLGFSWLEGLLLGSIVSSTDAAAVFSVIRTTSVKLKGTLEPLIELESGSNDPIAVFLTMGLIGLMIDPGASVLGLLPSYVWQMALGAALGFGIGWATALLLNRLRLSIDGLYPVLTVSTVLLSYGATTLLGGNGFLAVYVAGVTLGNQNFVHKRSLARFHDAMAWLMQIALFLTLGLLVFPSQLVPVAGGGLLMALFLIAVARPASVFVALLFSNYGWREKLLIAWSGLRGAVPIVLATFPLLAGVGRAHTLFNLVFFIVLASVLIQGTTIALVARLLGLNDAQNPDYHYPNEFVPDVDVGSQVAELAVRPGSSAAGRSIMELGLPVGALVILVRRGDDKLVPSGATVLEPGDRLLVLAGADMLPAVQGQLDR